MSVEGAPTTPLRFRKKPVDVDAMRWDGTATGATPVIDWVLGNAGTARYTCDGFDCVAFGCAHPDTAHHIAIDTLEGTMRANPGDWIIRGVKGEFYPCKPDIFDETYTPLRGYAPGGHVPPPRTIPVPAGVAPDGTTYYTAEQVKTLGADIIARLKHRPEGTDT